MSRACFLGLSALACAPGLAGERAGRDPRPHPKLSGGFRLEKRTYSVGEPILAVFEFTNNGKTPFSFFAIGSRAHRQLQFDATIEDAAGKRVEPPPAFACGGVGGIRTLKPRGGRYVEYFLLSRWAHLLPPGRYVARASRTLKPGFVSKAGGPTIRGTMAFRVVPYDHKRMQAAVRALGRERRGRAEGTFFGRPTYRALDDVAKTFNLSVNVWSARDVMRDRELTEKIASGLPKKWDDRYYLEPKLEENRNWLTAAAPEEFTLTFSVRNNSRRPLPTGILESRLCVDGKEIAAWKEMLAGVAKRKTLDQAGGGKRVEFALQLNDYVKASRRFTWEINGRTLQSDQIRLRKD